MSRKTDKLYVLTSKFVLTLTIWNLSRVLFCYLYFHISKFFCFDI